MANSKTIRRQDERFQQCGSLEEVAVLLQTSPSKIKLCSLQPRYNIYTISKGNGKTRLIEDPGQPLKGLLKKLNGYLQACYYVQRPAAVHGFSISASNEEERGIISNAGVHMGKPWLLNIDFRDFFHTVLSDTVLSIWQKHFRKFKKQLPEVLTSLTCFHNRLPMGSPTSPVLSNFAALAMDEELMQLCANMGITYSRFADDCSFSARHEIDNKTVQLLRDVITAHRFMINEEKLKLFGPDDEKIVTGIIVEEKRLKLPEIFIQQLQQEIIRLEHTLVVERRFQTGMSAKKLKLFEQELRGKINYVQMVLGDTAETNELVSSFENARQQPDNYESDNWLDLPYNFF